MVAGVLNDDIDIVVAGTEGLGRKSSGTVEIDTIGAADSIAECIERWVVQAAIREISGIGGIVSVRSMVGDDVYGSCREQDN